MKPSGVAIILAFLLTAGWNPALEAADDFGDGISEAKDEAISEYDNLGSKSTNINFAVVEALTSAKKTQSSGRTITNYDDGSDIDNENSIVVEPGSRVDKVINIVIGK